MMNSAKLLKIKAAAELELRERAKTRAAVDPDPVTWIEQEFYVPELGGPLQLVDYQRAVLREAYRRDANGRFVYDLVLWSDLKKSIKSTIAAAVAAHRALLRPWSSIKIVANDLKQADSRVFFYIQRAIALNPRLRSRASMRTNKIRLDNKSTVEAVPVDPKGEAGGNDDFIEFTELHAANSKAAVLMWAEMTISPTKHGYAQRWVDTYAGHSGEAPILEPLYARCVREENRLHLPGMPSDLALYAVGKMLCLWNIQPRLPWQTPEYYASEAATLTEKEFRRIHRNEWVTSEDVFVQPEWWDACRVSALPPLDRYLELSVALDAAVSGDCFGVLATSRHGNQVAVRFSRKWEPSEHGGKLIYGNSEDPDSLDYPEGVIRWLAREYNVLVFNYDPYQLHDLCTRLNDEGIGYFRPFNQGAPRLVADKQLYDLIRERRILHSGEPDLTAHVKNANSKSTDDNKLRIVKRADHLKIDLAVCLSMATEGAMAYLSDD